MNDLEWMEKQDSKRQPRVEKVGDDWYAQLAVPYRDRERRIGAHAATIGAAIAALRIRLQEEGIADA
jgi:hypothetical protein